MGKIEERFPAYKGKLSILDAWTPMTYVRYCSAYKGFYQSFMISKYSAKNPYPSAYVKGIDNIILAGQWINPPGGLSGFCNFRKVCSAETLQKGKYGVYILSDGAGQEY